MEARREGGRVGVVARVEAWVRTHPKAVDACLVAVPAAALVLAGAVDGDRSWVLTSLVQVAALAARRARPVLSAVVVYALAALHLVAVPLLGARWGAGELAATPSDVVVLVSLYSLAAHAPRWARNLGLLTALAGALLLGAAFVVTAGDGLRQGAVDGVVLAVVCGVCALLAWTAGQWRRARLDHLSALEDRARAAETERGQVQALATAAERARIAREVHDVVAHSLSVVIAQADGGRYAASADPAAATRALEQVAATGRAALADMRRLLGVLREGSEAGLEPQPGIADVPELVACVRDSGLAVALVLTGDPRPLSAGASLAVYRVVQEGLTNVLKHAGPTARATVRLHWSPGRLEAHVEDDGRGASTGDGAGRGLAGMAERMALYGGTAHAGPRPGGGFAVQVVLPVPGQGAPVLSTAQTAVDPAVRSAVHLWATDGERLTTTRG